MPLRSRSRLVELRRREVAAPVRVAVAAPGDHRVQAFAVEVHVAADVAELLVVAQPDQLREVVECAEVVDVGGEISCTRSALATARCFSIRKSALAFPIGLSSTSVVRLAPRGPRLCARSAQRLQ